MVYMKDVCKSGTIWALMLVTVYGMYVPRTINLLCAPDDCTSKDIKESIMSCWPNKGREAWNTCVGNRGGCTLMDATRANDCLMSEVYNMTDLKVSEHRELRYKMFYSKALVDCAGDKITIKMVMCSASPGGVQLRPAADVADS